MRCRGGNPCISSQLPFLQLSTPKLCVLYNLWFLCMVFIRPYDLFFGVSWWKGSRINSSQKWSIIFVLSGLLQHLPFGWVQIAEMKIWVFSNTSRPFFYYYHENKKNIRTFRRPEWAVSPVVGTGSWNLATSQEVRLSSNSSTPRPPPKFTPQDLRSHLYRWLNVNPGRFRHVCCERRFKVQ